MNGKLGWAALAAAVSMTASCGGRPGLAGASGTVNAAALTALFAGTAMGTQLDGLVFTGTGNVTPPLGLPAGVGFVASLNKATNYDPCTVKTGSQTTDADADGIAKFFRQDFNCTSLPANPGTYSRVGYFQELDKDDTKHSIQGGFKYEMNFSSDYDAPHELDHSVWRGTWEATVDGATIVMGHDYTLVSDNEQRTGPRLISKFATQTQWTQTYRPTNLALPWQAGTYSLDGFVRFSGNINHNNKLVPIDVVFAVKATNLTYDRTACPGGHFRNGFMSFTDGGGNVLKYTYVNCTMTRTFNGQTI